MSTVVTKFKSLERPMQLLAAAGLVIVGILALGVLISALKSGLGVGVVVLILFLPYWAPSIVAACRHHQSTAGIVALNFLLGWTVLGWIAALVWSLSSTDARQVTVVVNQTNGGADSARGSYTPVDGSAAR